MHEPIARACARARTSYRYKSRSAMAMAMHGIGTSVRGTNVAHARAQDTQRLVPALDARQRARARAFGMYM